MPPRAECGPGSSPAPGLQGRVTADVPGEGYRCNTQLVGHEGAAGGFKVERFVDRAGRQCAYYDGTLMFPVQAIQQLRDEATGVAVVDMTDPAKPVRTATLSTPAMQTPHESLILSEKRGLLVAVMGNASTYPGFVDIYDVNEDCREPVLQASLPVGLLGHESGMAPDGNTFYSTSLFSGQVTAVDITNPKVPTPLAVFDYPSHGFAVSNDGNRGYVAALGAGLIVVDTSQVQARQPNPEMPEISRLDWPFRSIPQNNIPVTFDGKPHLIEVDEFSADEQGNYDFEGNAPHVGAARIIDITNEREPKVVSNLRLEVNQPKHREEIGGDPGAGSALQGYAAHYCGVPRQDDPEIVVCSFILSGLRVFDIRDPYHPKEVAYFVAPPATSPVVAERTNYAMSKPAFDVARKIVWYSDGNSGLYAVRLTNGAWPSGNAGSLHAAEAVHAPPGAPAEDGARDGRRQAGEGAPPRRAAPGPGRSPARAAGEDGARADRGQDARRQARRAREALPRLSLKRRRGGRSRPFRVEEASPLSYEVSTSISTNSGPSQP